ncbi:MAG: tyrosine-type recombinase/integrase, partial [Nitrososphaerota archaeon]|nr:tyrosine-type recombinase/integrase [Nitrososphaerota archaeon]
MIDWSKEEEFLQNQFVKSHSVHSRHFYSASLRRFKEFLAESKITEVDGANVYDVLNRFVQWNDKRGLRAKTIVGYVHSTKKFLLYQDFQIDETRLKAKVSVPRVLKIEDEPLTTEMIRRLLVYGKPNKNMRALILVLVSSGMRLAEALSIRVRDIDLKSRPAKVHIRAEYSKTKRDRHVFISDEAVEAVGNVVEGALPDDYALGYSSANVFQREKVATVSFNRKPVPDSRKALSALAEHIA